MLLSLPRIPTLLGLVLFCIKRADRGLVLLDESPSNKFAALQPAKKEISCSGCVIPADLFDKKKEISNALLLMIITVFHFFNN